MKITASHPKIAVSADGTGAVSQAGGVLLTQALRVTGLERGLSAALSRWRPARAAHDPGKIVADLTVAMALGGDCLADVAMLRAEPALFGPVASDPVVSRLVTRLAGDAARALKEIRAARAAARARAWELAGQAAPGAGGGLVTIDIDATIVTACSEKEQAAPTWKKPTAIIRSPFSLIMVPRAAGSRYWCCCGRAMLARILLLITSRLPGSGWRSCPAACGTGCCSAPIPAAARTSSWSG
jgi:hypothetical protein